MSGRMKWDRVRKDTLSRDHGSESVNSSTGDTPKIKRGGYLLDSPSRNT
jgi:hypothetical protein